MRLIPRLFWDRRRGRLGSIVCQAADFETVWYREWAGTFGRNAPEPSYFGEEFAAVFRKVWEAMHFYADGLPTYRHRKMWEWCAIAQALHQRGLLRPGVEAVGFAVGQEPLPSLFGAMGMDVLATDLDDSSELWAGQHAGSLEALRWPNLISKDELSARVAFRPADMRDLREFRGRTYDVLWSSCSLEHLGSLEAGLRFVEESSELLKPGGIAVHTTEYNVSSNDATAFGGDTVLYRARDIEQLAQRLEVRGVTLATPNFNPGSHEYDQDHDVQPWYTTGRQHVKLLLGEYVTTSMLLVCRRRTH